MNGFVADIKYCKKCKNFYDANVGLNMLHCPYCLQKQKPIFSPLPSDKTKPHIPSWPF